MEMRISFPGNAAVVASFGAFTVRTDQPKDSGGDGAAPTPFELFLASVGACAGHAMLAFCRKQGLATDGLELTQTAEWAADGRRVSTVTLRVALPPDSERRETA